MAVGRWGRWTLRRRVGAAVVLLALVTVVFGGWIGWQAWDARAAVLDEQQMLLPATANVEALLASFVTQEASVRGYALTGQHDYLATDARAAAQSQRLLRTLDGEIAGHPAAVAALDTVHARYRTWLAQGAGPAIADRTAVGQAEVDRLWAAVTDLQDQVVALTAEADASVDSMLSNTVTLIIVRGGILLVLIAAVLFLLRRWINEPVEQLAGELRMVVGGELDRPVESQGPPELASLGRDVEGVRRRLRDEAEELRQLRQALAEHSPLHVMLHSELESVTSDPAFAGRLLPAEGVLAGDWYDVWDRGDAGIAAALVDISGHGPAAGLFALKLKHVLSPPIRYGASPGDAVGLAAGECAGTDEQFATGIVVEIDGGRCRYANAGHPSGLLFRDGRVEELPATGPLMCVLPGSWRTDEIDVAPGDLLVLVTDGVTEARLPDGSEFGTDGVVDVVRGQDRSPDDVAESIVSAVRERCRMPLKDDATVVVIRIS
jgi:serine phosphatase RsbU (regulator of sigma subunit)/CHASE3 domain sensor protein